MALADPLDRAGGLGRFQSLPFPSELLTSQCSVEDILAPFPVTGAGFPNRTGVPLSVGVASVGMSSEPLWKPAGGTPWGLAVGPFLHPPVPNAASPAGFLAEVEWIAHWG